MKMSANYAAVFQNKTNTVIGATVEQIQVHEFIKKLSKVLRPMSKLKTDTSSLKQSQKY